MNKRHFCYLFVLALVFSTVSGYGLSAQRKSEKSRVTEELAADWAQIKLKGGYVIENNVWNKTAAKGVYKQSIFQGDVNGKPMFGWQWQGGSDTMVVGYPEVIYGDKPWNSPRGVEAPPFPFRVGSTNLKVNYDIKSKVSGCSNLAFSLWVVSQIPATSREITHEIMVWIDNHGMSPAGQKKGVLETDGGKFDVYLRENHADASGQNANVWTYIAFVAHQPLLKKNLDLAVFIDYLVKQKIVTPDQFLTGLEFGAEVVGGKGRIEVTDYSVSSH